jgi:hypothetical protein
MANDILSKECLDAGYSLVDCDNLGGTAIFPEFGKINLRELTPETCETLHNAGFRWLTKADSKGKKPTAAEAKAAEAAAKAQAEAKAAEAAAKAQAEAKAAEAAAIAAVAPLADQAQAEADATEADANKAG